MEREVVVRASEQSSYDKEVRSQRYDLEYIEDTEVIFTVSDIPWSGVPAVLSVLLQGRIQLSPRKP